jgi:3-hydroxyisobutyrate dehydrogenase
MGHGMAASIQRAGHDLSVYNRTAEKAESLAAKGARVCASAREAARAADVIIAMTSDDASSRAMWLGPDGVLASDFAANALAIECSTLSHEWVLQLAQDARERGLRYIDAPVTGLPADAAAGKLTLLIGAEEGDLQAARPVLSAFSNRIVHFGPPGCGTVYKLMINLMGAVQIAAAAEGMALAERAGLDLALVADTLASGQAASPQVVRNTRRMATGDHERDIAFTPALRLKDVDYALQLARSLGLPVPFGRTAQEAFKQLCQSGNAEVSESKIIDIVRAR